VVLLILLLTACGPDAMAIVSKAAARADSFDLPGALEVARRAGDCDEAAGGAEYLEGLLGAAEAVKHGGTVDSLREVRSAVNALSRRSETAGRRWEAASAALRAVAAASQYERAEMTVFLAEATRVEALLVAAGLPGAPFISAHELAGDLWMQLHGYAEARVAYVGAAKVVGRTGRVRLGLARAAAGLKDVTGACVEYRSLIEWWEERKQAATPPEIAEARTYIASLGCVAGRPLDRRR
jgi:hypothetical protein